MSFSSGDYIAIAVGSIATLRWMVDAFFKKADTDEEKLNVLRLDFEKEKAANAATAIANAATMARIERGLNNIQAQFRMLVNGSSNKRLKITDLDAEDDQS